MSERFSNNHFHKLRNYDQQLLNMYTNEKHFVREIDKSCPDKYQNIPKCIYVFELEKISSIHD